MENKRASHFVGKWGPKGLLRKHSYRSKSLLESYGKMPIKWSNKIAYLAGLIDGEGYFKTEKQGTLRLIIGMCSKKTIMWIKRNFGGNVTCQATAKGRDFWVWRLNWGKELFYLLLLLIPFLTLKKHVAVTFFKRIVSRFKKLDYTVEYLGKGKGE